jgi:hypothetical protein
MKIVILGNGGAINDGLPYNSFIIDEKYLIETPPDIMTSLYRENIDLSKIQLIYISHFHGDHYFGLPFLVLRLFFNSINKETNIIIKIVGPQNIKDKIVEICKLSVGDNHPLNKWIENNIKFIEISSNDEIFIGDDLIIKLFPMFHFIDTWGFSLYKNHKIIITYFADTIWDDKLINQIQLYPKVIISDVNGEPSDPVNVHLTENDIITKILPVCKDNTIIYGTHLKHQKKSFHKNLKYTYPGEIIELE